MPNTTVSLPTEVSPAGDVARRLARWLGPAFRAVDGSNLAASLLALGGALAGGRTTLLAAVSEAFPDTAVQCLSEWEAYLGLTDGGALVTADRQARLVAKLRAGFSSSVPDIVTALQAIASEATIAECAAWQVPAAPRQVFNFAVILTVADTQDPVLVAQIADVLSAMESAHTGFTITNSVGFLTDDDTTPSWTDLTVLDE